jgi:hypothetical protein
MLSFFALHLHVAVFITAVAGLIVTLRAMIESWAAAAAFENAAESVSSD